MLQLIFQWLMSAAGGVLEVVINIFMKALDMDMNTYIGLFPFLATGYKVFRGIGTGLAAVLAVTSLLKFLTPGLFGAREPLDTVPGILIKTAAAGALVYGGNFILVKIVEIAKIPYNIFLGLDASGAMTSEFSWDFVTRMVETFTGLEAAEVVFEFMVTVLVAWNLIKLMLEVCERFMLVGILVYTSPPFFAMVASTETIDSFKRWLKMFISSCAMMSVSVFFLKLILSGFSVINAGLTESGVHVFVRTLLLLATCKIAQRADGYLAQIGLGTAQTGGALLDDMLAAGRALGGIFSSGVSSGHGGGRNTVLGAAATAMSRNGGIFGKTVDSFRAGKEAYTAGDPKDEVSKKMKEAFNRANMMPRSVTSPAKAAATAVKNGPAAAAGQVGKDLSDAVKAGADIISPSMSASRADSINQKQAEDALSAFDAETASTLGQYAAAAEATRTAKESIAEDSKLQAEFAGPSEPDAFTLAVADAATSGGRISSGTAEENFARYGAIDPDTGSSVIPQPDGSLAPTPRAMASGVGIEDGRLTGSVEAVSEVIAGGYNPYEAVDTGYYMPDSGDITEWANRFRTMAVSTVSQGSPEISDRILHNPNLNIGGSEGVEIGAAAVRKLYPDLIPEGADISHVESFSPPDASDVSGNTIPGGHIWRADIENGNESVRVTGLDRTAFASLSAEERKLYERRDLPTGRTEYIRSEALTPEMRAESGSKRSHFVRVFPKRIRKAGISQIKPAFRSPSDVPGFPDSVSEARNYSEQRRLKRPEIKNAKRK